MDGTGPSVRGGDALKVSAGCDHCDAEAFEKRVAGSLAATHQPAIDQTRLDLLDRNPSTWKSWHDASGARLSSLSM